MREFPVGRDARASRVALSFGFKRFGRELSVRLLQKNFHAPFGFFQLLLAFARKSHALLEKLHCVVERELRAFQLANNFLQPRERAFKIRPFGLFWFFRCWLIHTTPFAATSRSRRPEFSAGRASAGQLRLIFGTWDSSKSTGRPVPRALWVVRSVCKVLLRVDMRAGFFPSPETTTAGPQNRARDSNSILKHA